MPQYVPKPEYILTEVEKERLISAWNGGCTTLKELIEVTIGEKRYVISTKDGGKRYIASIQKWNQSCQFEELASVTVGNFDEALQYG